MHGRHVSAHFTPIIELLASLARCPSSPEHVLSPSQKHMEWYKSPPPAFPAHYLSPAADLIVHTCATSSATSIQPLHGLGLGHRDNIYHSIKVAKWTEPEQSGEDRASKEDRVTGGSQDRGQFITVSPSQPAVPEGLTRFLCFTLHRGSPKEEGRRAVSTGVWCMVYGAWCMV